MGLRAVIFDVDGTLAETERHGHRVAFNRAFAEAGLADHWDERRYGELLTTAGGEARLRRHFIEAGRSEAQGAELAARIHPTKTRLFREIVTSGEVAPRPGVLRLLGDLHAARITLAVATTGTRDWVLALLQMLLSALGGARFEVVVTGNDVTTLKPDPQAFVLALDRLGVCASDAIVVEDSANGVGAALGAGVTCVGVPGDYNTPDDVAGAALILDGYGEPGAPARVLHDPLGVATSGILDAQVLTDLRERSA